ncbi:G-protein coupled receptor 171 [Microcaecilia unicolor]|uniref:G-protein coupled receptor 171 n=1 Tax=Microcaecilia unicolor TaxID=1415580 RepID=A0A6P7Z588_9AMPH|nr:probable G-protein coupled receptor 171 [Microcaecilia unicolor]XP_030072587.1 probable G-protein coupled receptor 171 [Microcaecilia unicolor]XP_030072588.1 probable G-protein coupled receptor 171 [Microcaecilia unicolor]
MMPAPSSNVSQCSVYGQMEPFTYFYYLVFLVGFIGSCVALWAFTRGDTSRKCISIYLINLLTADFLLTLALPFKIAVDLGIAPWKLKIFHCQVTACIIYINMYLSITFLAFVSMDRCLQIINSSKFYQIQKHGFAKMISTVVWALILLIMVPNMLIPIKSITEKPTVGCMEFKQKLGRDWHVLTNFISIAIFFNFSAIILASNFLAIKQLYKHKDTDDYQNTKQALVNILLVTAGYIICFLPYHIVRIPYTLSQNDVITDCALKQYLFKAKESTLLLSVSNLCFDPILYFYLSKPFRSNVTRTFTAQKKVRQKDTEELNL